MDRRGFLKRIGQTIAGLAIVPSAAKANNPAPKDSVDLESDWIEYLEDKFTKLSEPPPFESEFNRVQRDKMFLRGMSKAFANKVMTYQDILRTEEEYEEYIRAIVKAHNFPKEKIMD